MPRSGGWGSAVVWLVATVFAMAGCGRWGLSPLPVDGPDDADVGEDGDADGAPTGDGDADGDGDVDGDADADADGDGDVDDDCDYDPCRLVLPQCGCSVTDACLLGDDDAVCGPAGLRALGEACSPDDPCAAGLLCSSLATPTRGTCKQMCWSSTDCADPSVCTNLRGAPVLIGTCMIDCDPVSTAGCAPGYACRIGIGEDMDTHAVGWIVGCGGETGLPEGEACASAMECEAGHFCANDHCRRLCLDPGGSCSGGETCYGGDPAIAVAGIEYGVCF